MQRQIILKDLNKPQEMNTTEDIKWLGDCFGFCAGRDTEQTSHQILRKILEEISRQGSTTTEQIAKQLNISIQRVNYHLRTLIDSGFLLRQKKLIIVRQGSIKAAIEEMRKDANRMFDNLSEIGEEIDNNIGLKNR